jgi:hypothetical protein
VIPILFPPPPCRPCTFIFHPNCVNFERKWGSLIRSQFKPPRGNQCTMNFTLTPGFEISHLYQSSESPQPHHQIQNSYAIMDIKNGPKFSAAQLKDNTERLYIESRVSSRFGPQDLFLIIQNGVGLTSMQLWLKSGQPWLIDAIKKTAGHLPRSTPAIREDGLPLPAMGPGSSIPPAPS